MSYDVYLEYGPVEDPVTAWDGNYTSNVSRMWTAALGENLGDLIDRNPAPPVLGPLLGQAADKIRADSTLDEFAPDNGWGDRLGAAQFLENIAVACRRFPDSRVRVWR